METRKSNRRSSNAKNDSPDPDIKQLEERNAEVLQLALAKEKEADEAEQRAKSESMQMKKRLAAAELRRLKADHEIVNMRIVDAEERLVNAKEKEEAVSKLLEEKEEEEKKVDIDKLRAEDLESQAEEAEIRALNAEKRAAEAEVLINKWRQNSSSSSSFGPYPDPRFDREREDIRRRQEIKTLKKLKGQVYYALRGHKNQRQENFFNKNTRREFNGENSSYYGGNNGPYGGKIKTCFYRGQSSSYRGQSGSYRGNSGSYRSQGRGNFNGGQQFFN